MGRGAGPVLEDGGLDVGLGVDGAEGGEVVVVGDAELPHLALRARLVGGGEGRDAGVGVCAFAFSVRAERIATTCRTKPSNSRHTTMVFWCVSSGE